MTNHNQQYADMIRKQYDLQPRNFRRLEADKKMTIEQVARIALPPTTLEKWYADYGKELERLRLGL